MNIAVENDNQDLKLLTVQRQVWHDETYLGLLAASWFFRAAAMMARRLDLAGRTMGRAAPTFFLVLFFFSTTTGSSFTQPFACKRLSSSNLRSTSDTFNDNSPKNDYESRRIVHNFHRLIFTIEFVPVHANFQLVAVGVFFKITIFRFHLETNRWITFWKRRFV